VAGDVLRENRLSQNFNEYVLHLFPKLTHPRWIKFTSGLLSALADEVIPEDSNMKVF